MHAPSLWRRLVHVQVEASYQVAELTSRGRRRRGSAGAWAAAGLPDGEDKAAGLAAGLATGEAAGLAAGDATGLAAGEATELVADEAAGLTAATGFEAVAVGDGAEPGPQAATSMASTAACQIEPDRRFIQYSRSRMLRSRGELLFDRRFERRIEHVPSPWHRCTRTDRVRLGDDGTRIRPGGRTDHEAGQHVVRTRGELA